MDRTGAVITSSPAGSAGQEIHITSATISHTRSRVENELKGTVKFVRSLIGTVHVDSPGFGVVGGMLMSGAYEGICRDADALLGDAEKAVDSWCQALVVAERNWRTAEDHSIVRYR
ncbi:hypothetical protein OHA77_27710 [Streptosporangium sp. NBC_01639]|uniref:hypothetical protein n=1 Tax=Streptosporangium sp. NBC_01639 TaxID=2975948 RepID=UPI003864045D|nr:hypothetical protein OHA77_27710 [Streptosporangium sp. NBC_01639]